MSLRYLLWFAVLVLLLIAGWQFLRALRAARGETRPASVAVPAAAQREAAGNDREQEGDGAAPLPLLRSEIGTRATGSPAAPAPEAFQLELDNRRLRSELAALQALSEQQQSEIRALQSELEALSALQQPGSSPEYSEALVLAAQGLGADAIAARCGISVAEAELVLSLSSGRGS